MTMRRWFFGPGSLLTRVGMWFLGPMRFTGLEHVPRDGAFILVANHISLFDPLIVGSTAGQLAGRLVHFMAKQEVRRWPVIGWLATQAGVYFVRRGEGDRAAQRLSLELLASGEAIAVFPEGTRSRNGVLGEPRNGAALLAMRSGVPVLPVSITGSNRIIPRGARLPRRSRVTVRVGEPFLLTRQASGRIDRQELAAGTERIMRAIAALLPPAQRGRFG
ncbi:MAG: 1-acyl-sn-glycerol-3-phosphate acyltransferase [Chloroflexi bacterium]|nr:MAG: 1-acyl-sn-glycerol-3-phosphate acyltransferase [Chloroflexota bacterium]